MSILAYYEDGGLSEFSNNDNDRNTEKSLTISHSKLYEAIIFKVPHQVVQAKLLGVVETEPEMVLQFCNEVALLEGFVEDLLAVVLHRLVRGIHFTEAFDDPVY